MEIYVLGQGDPLWEKVIPFAEDCPWSAGPYLANMMKNGEFGDWERVISAFDGDRPAGFCTFTEYDSLPEETGFTPFIGFMYVDEQYRGHRLSEKMAEAAVGYARSLGYTEVYLTSDEKGLYEKYGFVPVGIYMTHRGVAEQLFRREI